MPQTRMDIEQAAFLGGSGTFTAGEELIEASGQAVQNAIDQTIDLLPTVVQEVQTIFNFPFNPLPLRGDDSAGTPLTVEGFPVMRLNKNGSDFITWTRRAPAGGASGVRFQFAWTPDGTATGNVLFRMTFNSFGSGILLGDTIPQEVELDLAGPSHGGSWDENRVYIHDMVPSGALGAVETFNLKLEYIGVSSTINQNINILNCAVNFQDLSASGV